MKKNNYSLFILFIVLLTSNIGFSQSKSAKDTSTTVIIFNSGGNTSKNKSLENSIIKIAPLSFLTGKFPITYERRITDFLSVQAGAGLTSKNYVRSAVQAGINLDEDDKNYKITSTTLPVDVKDDTNELYNFDNRKATLGYMVSVQPRIYFENEGLEGPFMALSLDHYRYNFEIPVYQESNSSYSHTGPAKNEYEKITDFMVLFGTQYLYDKISLEYTIGIGLRSVKGNKYAAGVKDNNLYEGTTHYSQSLINLAGGIKVGYHF